LTSFPLSGILLSTVALVGGLTREGEMNTKALDKAIKEEKSLAKKRILEEVRARVIYSALLRDESRGANIGR
jgi:ADP-ribose pyrophosphatase YjhB (NUDIX family)